MTNTQKSSNDTFSPHLHGPEDLVDRLLAGRAGGTTAGCGRISNSGLERLVDLAYYASQTVEEGKLPQFRLFVPVDSRLPNPLALLRFHDPVPLEEVDQLRRLGPCASSHEFALEVEEADADGSPRLRCVGIRMAHSGEATPELFSPAIWARRVAPGLMIRVDGPGQLRVSEARNAFDLRAGELHELGSLPLQPVQPWQDDLSKRLCDENEVANENEFSHAISSAWNELVHNISRIGRGGCLIILPLERPTIEEVKTNSGIELKYSTADACISERIVEFLKSCGHDYGQFPNEEQLRESAKSWLRRRFGMGEIISSISYLAGVDGCTVFDRNLRLIGFGGKINVKSENGIQKEFRDGRTNEALSSDMLKSTGTRHRSAFNFCYTENNVAAYVISQDGHVTLFWSCDELVYRWTPYWPWIKASDHF